MFAREPTEEEHGGAPCWRQRTFWFKQKRLSELSLDFPKASDCAFRPKTFSSFMFPTLLPENPSRVSSLGRKGD